MGILAIAEATQTMGVANCDAQSTAALWLIYLVSCNLPLTMAWSTVLNKDQFNYFQDSLAVSAANPQGAAQAAADFTTCTADQASMNAATGFQTTMVQNEKSLVKNLGNAMDQVYDVESPLAQLLKQTTNLILGFAS
jgi:hypothetical protein